MLTFRRSRKKMLTIMDMIMLTVIMMLSIMKIATMMVTTIMMMIVMSMYLMAATKVKDQIMLIRMTKVRPQ